jgi:phage I-like protein
MPEAIKAALTTPLSLSTPDSSPVEAPSDLQYMPPGTHRINASRNGKPVSLEITVDASTAETLNNFLQAQLIKATEGNDDRPFFDFNHEDREAAAWPTEFYWAGDDPLTGGVRAKVDWSGAGKKAVTEKTFRRFSPTFVPDEAGHVVGSETNMGGLVNRAAFKTIAPLFAKSESNQSMPNPIQAKLHALKLIDSIEASDESAAQVIEVKFNELQSRIDTLETEKDEAGKARAASHVEAAVNAGRIAPKDDDAKAFWQDALIRDEAKAVKALESLPANPVLAKVTDGDDPKSSLLDKMQLQQKKLAEVQAAHPGADFQTIFAKAQTEAPDLFR